MTVTTESSVQGPRGRCHRRRLDSRAIMMPRGVRTATPSAPCGCACPVWDPADQRFRAPCISKMQARSLDDGGDVKAPVTQTLRSTGPVPPELMPRT